MVRAVGCPVVIVSSIVGCPPSPTTLARGHVNASNSATTHGWHVRLMTSDIGGVRFELAGMNQAAYDPV